MKLRSSSPGVHHLLRHHPAVTAPDGTTRGERAAQHVADLLGSWRFIGLQTGIIILWIVYNTVVASEVLSGGRFDPYPFILLNLAFSTQAAYAAPLLQLASNRQSTLMAQLMVDMHAMVACMHATPETGSCTCPPGEGHNR